MVENIEMEFYSSITDYYDFIFPFKQVQLDFVRVSLESSGAGRPAYGNPAVLDIGCATGSLAIGLAREGFSVTAADFDESMIAAARIRAARELDPSSDIRFRQLDMREIGTVFRDCGFDALICFGNTLVHLTETDEISDFLRQTAAVLGPRGIFMMQIINYDRILDRNIDGLASIENDQVRFERCYEYEAGTGLINFKTCLTDKKT